MMARMLYGNMETNFFKVDIHRKLVNICIDKLKLEFEQNINLNVTLNVKKVILSTKAKINFRQTRACRQFASLIISHPHEDIDEGPAHERI
ncbi:hypothetical protein TNCV_3638301 [Trichonephila clavipes]|nr:hypothetical protein TNCV_3638301 [Trichonephila clavipes]